ncbi:GNAT family N-acetyltransferase [Heyndrickxia sporothermodurans]
MKVIFEGTLNNEEVPFKISMLSLSHLHQILELQDLVIDSLENKDILQPLSLDEFEYILEGNGMMIGAFVNDDLIAFRALLIPPIDQDHLGLDIGLAEEDLSCVIYQEISNVHPKYRGNRLQQTLASIIMKQLSKLDQQYSYICCTVAPFNIPSLKDKFTQGMEIASLKEKYGDRLRYIFVKELNEKKRENHIESTMLRMDDFKGQKQLLATGWRGIKMEKKDDEYWVVFGRNEVH